MYRNIFQKLILLQDTEPENVVIHTWSWTPKKYEQFMVSPSTGANRSPKQGHMTTSVRKMRHINDLHGKHSCHIIRQRNAPEMVLTTCGLKLREQRQVQCLCRTFLGCCRSPPLLTRTASPPHTAESCCPRGTHL